MKRFLVLLGALCIALGLKINGGFNELEGELSEGTFDTHRVEGFLSSGPQRLDVTGDMETAKEYMARLGAKELLSEKVDDIDIIYAYSLKLGSPVEVHGYKVNLMIAVSERGVTLGTPLIYGSY